GALVAGGENDLTGRKDGQLSGECWRLESPQLVSAFELAPDDERRLDRKDQRPSVGEVSHVQRRLVRTAPGEAAMRHSLTRQRIAPASLARVMLDARGAIVGGGPPPVGIPLGIAGPLEKRGGQVGA